MATIYHVRANGPAGCLLGVCVSILAIAALAVFAVLGIVTLTVAVWIAASFVLLALIAAMVGRIAGPPRQEDR
jgi:membrane protein implicated in regulation of membrane protease activity